MDAARPVLWKKYAFEAEIQFIGVNLHDGQGIKLQGV
jgi:hypothetical protein